MPRGLLIRKKNGVEGGKGGGEVHNLVISFDCEAGPNLFKWPIDSV